MKKPVSWKLDENIIEMINKLSEEKKWKKTMVITEAIKEYYNKYLIENEN